MRRYKYFECPKCGIKGKMAEQTKDGQRIVFNTCPICGAPFKDLAPTEQEALDTRIKEGMK